MEVGIIKWAEQKWVLIMGAGQDISAITFQPDWPLLPQVEVNIPAKKQQLNLGIVLWGMSVWVFIPLRKYTLTSFLGLVGIAPSSENAFSKTKPISLPSVSSQNVRYQSRNEKLALYKIKLTFRRLPRTSKGYNRTQTDWAVPNLSQNSEP